MRAFGHIYKRRAAAEAGAHAQAGVGAHGRSAAQTAAEAQALSRETEREVAQRLDFFHLFWLFVLASFVGLVVETLVSYPIDGEWKDRAGLVWGPFSPIYGAGAVIMTLALYRHRNQNAMVLFLAAGLLGGAFELVAGTFWESTFGFVAWSYQDQPFNIAGHTCLGIACVWGLAGVLWAKVFMEPIMSLIELIPQPSRKAITGVAAVLMAADIAMTLVAFSCWFDRDAGKPIENPVQQFCAQEFSDEFMQDRFQTISMYPQLAYRN